MGATAFFVGGMTAAISAVLFWSGLPESNYFLAAVGSPDYHFSGHELRVGKAVGGLACFLLASGFVMAKVPRLARRGPLIAATLISAAMIVALSAFFVLRSTDETIDAYVARLANLEHSGTITETDLLEAEEKFLGTTPETRGRTPFVIRRGAGPFVAAAGGLIALGGRVVALRRPKSRGGESNP